VGEFGSRQVPRQFSSTIIAQARGMPNRPAHLGFIAGLFGKWR
jgi:hypothetical protein